MALERDFAEADLNLLNICELDVANITNANVNEKKDTKANQINEGTAIRNMIDTVHDVYDIVDNRVNSCVYNTHLDKSESQVEELIQSIEHNMSNVNIKNEEAASEPTTAAEDIKLCVNETLPKDEESKIETEASASLLLRLGGLASNKAGLEQVDKSKVNRVIYEASKNSAYFKNEEKRDTELTEKVNKLKQHYVELLQQDLSYDRAYVNTLVEALEQKRDLSHYIVLIDMDAFYASVEERDNPSVKGKPMAVGSTQMLTTANYEARKYGVRSAMPAIFSKYDPNFIAMSLDEAFLDITDHCHENDMSPEDVVQELRAEILKVTKLTASAGIAPNRMLAKVCADINKPNGQYRLPNDRQAIIEFLKDLPIRKISGIGRVTERILNAVNVKTCKDIYEKLTYLYKLCYPCTFAFLIRVALGIGNENNHVEWTRKSLSVSRTFPSIRRPADIRSKLQELAGLLADDLAKDNLEGKVVTVTFKLVTFKTFTRAKTLQKYVYSKKEIYNCALPILEAELPLHVRLLGIRLGNLRSRNEASTIGVKRFLISTDEPYENKKIKSEDNSPTNNNVKESNDNTEYDSNSLGEMTNYQVLSLHKLSDNFSIEEMSRADIENGLREELPMNEDKQSLLSPTKHSLALQQQPSTPAKSEHSDEIAFDIGIQSDSLPTNSELFFQLLPTTGVHNNNIPEWQCPVCNRSFAKVTELRANTHVDSCLNGRKLSRTCARKVRGRSSNRQANSKATLLTYFNKNTLLALNAALVVGSYYDKSQQFFHTSRDDHLVGNLPYAEGEQPIEKSYAGYIDVRDFSACAEGKKASLFYWLFPAQEPKQENPPLIVWLQGGPGMTSMLALFDENGPLTRTPDFKIKRSNITWNKHYSMVFIDQPVGTGYSFVDPLTDEELKNPKCNEDLTDEDLTDEDLTDEDLTDEDLTYEGIFCHHPRRPKCPRRPRRPKDRPTGDEKSGYFNGYVSNEKGVAKDLMAFFDGFYKRYPELKKSDLYITGSTLYSGESYAGKYVPSISYAIHVHNIRARKECRLDDVIPLVGLSVASGFTDPASQVKEHAESAFQYGLITRADAARFRRYAKIVNNKLAKCDYLGALDTRMQLIDEFINITGGINYYDVRLNVMYDLSGVKKFMNTTEMRQALNIGERYFVDTGIVVMTLLGDIMRSTKNLFPTLIENYKVLLYQGNMDFRDGAAGNTDWLYSLRWHGSRVFKTKRKIWRIDGLVVGYISSYKNLTRAVVLNSGHFAPKDQQIPVLELVTNFIEE
ncbi:7773_t:CDS:10 [Paraglomus brasilianum]|uniref:DNA polymerase kappa n=1 Tax=Paraglomus brasilianum TaxID=144538 RepID=A0A9N9BEC4_9GLOM|nr:7773_t:CDS:10 [Paraglomus brasilianum]